MQRGVTFLNLYGELTIDIGGDLAPHLQCRVDRRTEAPVYGESLKIRFDVLFESEVLGSALLQGNTSAIDKCL